jgi:S-phase kinase-associated protein 1
MEIKGLDEDFEEVLTLVSRDGKRISITHTLAKVCDYLKNVIDTDSSVVEIELNQIDSVVIEKILEWLKYHEKTPPKDIPRPLPTSHLENIVGKWDAKFIDCNLDVVYELLLASNFLGIIPLLDLCCAKIAGTILGKTPEKIRETFGLPENFEYEDEAEIRKEFANYL